MADLGSAKNEATATEAVRSPASHHPLPMSSSSSSSPSGPLASLIVPRVARKNSFYGASEQELLVQPKPPSPQRDAITVFSTFSAGLGSGFLSSIACAPLDLVRTRLQVWGDVLGPKSASTTTSSTSAAITTKQTARAPPSIYRVLKEIIRQDGYLGCFRGLGATLVTVPLFWGVYFPLYDESKRYLTHHYPDTNIAVLHCGSAVFTGAIADVICNPLFVIRTRLQTQALHNRAAGNNSANLGMWRTAKDLVQGAPEGTRVLWRGMSANLMGLSHVAVQFPVYERLKQYARERKQQQQQQQVHGAQLLQEQPQHESAVELLLASGLAKMCASLLTYPHEVLRSRMMDSRATVAPTLRGTARAIHQADGIAGFYTGLPVTLIRVVPNCCITFVSYELLLRWSREYFATYRE
jgi:solute carrier family 25 (mitochondrial folate transporter), member 32